MAELSVDFSGRKQYKTFGFSKIKNDEVVMYLDDVIGLGILGSMAFVIIAVLLWTQTERRTALGITVPLTMITICYWAWVIAASNAPLEIETETVLKPSVVIRPNSTRYQIIAYTNQDGKDTTVNLTDFFQGWLPEDAKIKITFYKRESRGIILSGKHRREVISIVPETKTD